MVVERKVARNGLEDEPDDKNSENRFAPSGVGAEFGLENGKRAPEGVNLLE